MKYCPYKEACRGERAKEIEGQHKIPLTSKASKQLSLLTKEYVEVVHKIEPLEKEKEDLRGQLIEIMKEFGRREEETDFGVVKYGVRYKNYKDKKVIESLVLQGMIPVKEVPEEYLAVYPKRTEGVEEE
jgi:uncharacterized protein (UPF0335 family)